MLACSCLSGSCEFYILCSDSQKERRLPVISLLVLYGYTYCVGCVLQDPGPSDKSCGRTLGIVAGGGGAWPEDHQRAHEFAFPSRPKRKTDLSHQRPNALVPAEELPRRHKTTSPATRGIVLSATGSFANGETLVWEIWLSSRWVVCRKAFIFFLLFFFILACLCSSSSGQEPSRRGFD